MSLERRYKVCLLATSLLSVAAYAYAEYTVAAYEDSGLGLSILAVPAIALGWWVTERRGGVRWPAWLTYLVIAAIVGRGVMRALDEGVDVAVFCEFLTLVLAYKAWDHRRTRDHGQILTLCAFLAIGALLTGTSLLLGLMLALLTPLLLASVMLFQVRPDDKLGVAPAAVARSRDGRNRLRWAFGASLALIWMGSILVFIYFPREIGLAAFGDWGQTYQTGFNDHVDLGQAGLISESQETVLELELRRERRGRGGDDRPLGGGGEVFYLRGAVLDTYRPETGSWVRSERPDVQTISSSGRMMVPRAASEEQRGSYLLQSVVVRDGAAGPLFALWRPISVSFLGPHSRLTVRTTDLIMARPASSGPFRYTVRSFAPATPLSVVPWERRDVSFDSPVVRGVAERVLREAGIDPDPAVRPTEADGPAAEAIETFLRNSYGYTLELTAPPAGQDPIEWFLTSATAGHCEYFASAMTAMCRSVGIESRMVTGYVATEWDETARKYIVRASNAHAWTEVRVSAETWQTFDSTPPAELQRVHQPRGDWVSRLRRLFDRAENRWATGVVGYGETQRRQLIGANTPVITWIESKMRAVATERSSRAAQAATDLRQAVVGAFFGLMALVALLFAARFAWRAWWKARRSRRRQRGRRADPNLAFYADLLRALEKRGVAKPDYRPPVLHADVVAASQPGVAAAISRVAAIYYKAAFGGMPLSEVERREADRLVRELRRSRGSSAGPSL